MITFDFIIAERIDGNGILLLCFRSCHSVHSTCSCYMGKQHAVKENNCVNTLLCVQYTI